MQLLRMHSLLGDYRLAMERRHTPHGCSWCLRRNTRGFRGGPGPAAHRPDERPSPCVVCVPFSVSQLGIAFQTFPQLAVM